MHWLTNWERIYIYFRNQGVPREILNTICISEPEAAQISRLIRKTCPRTILEVGTFIGLSTGVIALAKRKESIQVCVDPGFPVKSISANFHHFEDRTTLSFVHAMLKHFGQEQRTILLRGFFSQLSTWAREQIVACGGDPGQAPIIGKGIGRYAPYGLAFIDGDHHADAVVGDLSLIAPYMAQNGIIVMHDVSHRWGEQVRAGIAQFVQTHPAYSLKTDHNLGFLSRDTEKTWLIPQRSQSLVKRIRWKIIRILSSVN
jgi:predicted O-methyltransferase YrrM